MTGAFPPNFTNQAPPESREAVKYKVLQVSRVVVSVRESAQVVEEILQAGQPVGLDGEGVNLGPKGQLTLVQVSTVHFTLYTVHSTVQCSGQHRGWTGDHL